MEDVSKSKDFLNNEKLKLPYNMVKYVNDVFGDWLKYLPLKDNHPDFDKFKDFNEYRNELIKITTNYFNKKYPTTRYSILNYKKSVELTLCTSHSISKLPDEAFDTVAFKLSDNVPELYLLVSNEPMILDEYSFDAYNKGPFMRPKW